MSGTINVLEVRRWAEYTLGQLDDYPDWLIDLIEFDQAPFHIYEVIGFSPASVSVDEDKALKGIALARGRTIESCSQGEAINALDLNLAILERFKAEFPFLADTIKKDVKPPQFEPPWQETSLDLEEELYRECIKGHKLYGIKAKAVARRQDNDDVLYELVNGSGEYAVVHLTWNKEKTPDWPWSEIYKSYEDWKTNRYLPDVQAWHSQ